MSDDTQIVERRLKLGDSTQQQRAAELLRSIEGVVTVKEEGAELRLRYDISQTSWAKVCEVLQSGGIVRAVGRIARWCDGWREFQDQNIRENLGHQAACCSKPPPGAGRR